MLRKLGDVPVAKAESFYVLDVDGPLLEGEPTRARGGGEQLGLEVLRRAHPPDR